MGERTEKPWWMIDDTLNIAEGRWEVKVKGDKNRIKSLTAVF